MSKGLWISPTNFVSFAEAKRRKGLTQHIATRSRSIDAHALGLYLPNPDPILKAQGKDITVYRDLRSTPTVGGNIRRRKSSVLSLERGLKRGAGSVRVERFIEDWLADLDTDRIVRELLDASLYGYQPVELMWQPLGLHLVPQDILGKPPEWFLYDQDSQLRFRARDAGINGELCDPQRFIVARQDASYANPYGFPDLCMCFWSVAFMRGGLKFWVQFSEKYGTPWLIGKHPRGAATSETELLLDSLEEMVQDAVAVIPNDSSVEIIESASKGSSADVFEKLLMYCRSEINIALLGQNQTTESSSTHASAQAGLDVTDDIRDADAGIVAAAMNAAIRLVVDLNFGESVPAPVYELWEQESIDEAQANRDKTLTESGVRFTKEYWLRTYNLEEGDIEIAEPAPAFAEPSKPFQPVPLLDQTALDQNIDVLPADQLQQQSEQTLEPLFDALLRARSDDEAQGLLAEAYPQMDTQALEEMLTRLLFAAEAWGRLSAQADRID